MNSVGNEISKWHVMFDGNTTATIKDSASEISAIRETSFIQKIITLVNKQLRILK